MPSNRASDDHGTPNRIATIVRIWTHFVRLSSVFRRLWRWVHGRVSTPIRGDRRQSIAGLALRTDRSTSDDHEKRWSPSLRRLAPTWTACGRVASAPFVRPTVTTLVVLVGLTGLAAAQSSTGGVCGTQAVDVFEWAASTGAEVITVGGLFYGAYKLARSVLTRNPEAALRHRHIGILAIFAGPIFVTTIGFGKQGAGAAGFTFIDCVNLT